MFCFSGRLLSLMCSFLFRLHSFILVCSVVARQLSLPRAILNALSRIEHVLPLIRSHEFRFSLFPYILFITSGEEN